MIYHDRVRVFSGGGRDSSGTPRPYVDEGIFPAQVNPLRSSESLKQGAPPLTLYYRLYIGAHGGDVLTPNGRIEWRSRTLSVQGDVEPWLVLGRLHHYEATLLAG